MPLKPAGARRSRFVTYPGIGMSSVSRLLQLKKKAFSLLAPLAQEADAEDVDRAVRAKDLVAVRVLGASEAGIEKQWVGRGSCCFMVFWANGLSHMKPGRSKVDRHLYLDLQKGAQWRSNSLFGRPISMRWCWYWQNDV